MPSQQVSATINGLEYNTQVRALNMMPAAIQQHVDRILENQHPLQQGIQLPYWGAKTTQRIRGNPTILQFDNANTNMDQYISEFNESHGPTAEDANRENEAQDRSNSGSTPGRNCNILE